MNVPIILAILDNKQPASNSRSCLTQFCSSRCFDTVEDARMPILRGNEHILVKAAKRGCWKMERELPYCNTSQRVSTADQILRSLVKHEWIHPKLGRSSSFNYSLDHSITLEILSQMAKF